MSIIITTKAKLIFFRIIKQYKIIKQLKDLIKIIDSKMKEVVRQEYQALM